MQGTVQLSEDRHSQRLPGSRDQSCQQRSALPAEIGGTRPQSFPSLEAVAFLQGNLTGTCIGGARKWNSRKTFKSRRQVYTPSQETTPSILSLLYRKAWSATSTMHIQTLSGSSSCRAAGRKIASSLHLPATQILQFRTAAVPLIGADIAAVLLGVDITTRSSCVAPIVDSVVRGSELYSTSRSTEQDNPMHSALAVADLWRSWRWKAGVVWILLCLLSWVLVWILLGLLGGSQCGYY